MLHQVLQIFESWAHHIGPDDFSEFAKPCVPPPSPDEPPVQSRSRGVTCDTCRAVYPYAWGRGCAAWHRVMSP